MPSKRRRRARPLPDSPTAYQPVTPRAVLDRIPLALLRQPRESGELAAWLDAQHLRIPLADIEHERKHRPTALDRRIMRRRARQERAASVSRTGQTPQAPPATRRADHAA